MQEEMAKIAFSFVVILIWMLPWSKGLFCGFGRQDSGSCA
jgi:hypothetical protein